MQYKNLKVAILFTLFSSNISYAKEYLGLDLGIQTKSEVLDILKKANAQYDTSYGYQGYSEDLPVIKVDSFGKFNKYGKLNESWLQFSPEGELYVINVVWYDSGKTFNVIKDALDKKYGKPSTRGTGFKVNYGYKDGDIDINLQRNTFGFDDSQTTGITYTFTPALKSVNDMKQKIDNDIREKNAKKAGSDF